MPTSTNMPTEAELKSAVSHFRELNRQFTTIDVMNHVYGSYTCDTEVPVKDSKDAQIETLIDKTTDAIKIREVKGSDSEGTVATTALWE